MRITFNTFHTSLLDRLNSLNSQQNTALTQLATGQRLQAPSDDSAATQRMLNLRTDKKQEQQFYKNAGKGLDISKATSSAVTQLNALGTRASELAASSNGISGTSALKAYASELDQLIEQGLTLANSKFQGNYLLGGTDNSTPPFTATRDPLTNKITGVTYAGGANGSQFRISESSSISPYTDGTENGQIASFLTTLSTLRDAITNNDIPAVQAARPALDTSEDNLLSIISRAGGIQYRMEVSSKQSTDRFESMENLIADETDIDFAEASVRLNRAQTAYQAAIQSGAKIERTSLLDYIG